MRPVPPLSTGRRPVMSVLTSMAGTMEAVPDEAG